MRKPFLFLLILTIFSLSYGFDKSKYDVKFPLKQVDSRFITNGKLAKVIGSDYLLLRNDKTECSLLPGGFFTIGTNQGLSTSLFDDSCQITFGHPYALTSFPCFAIDGVRTTPEIYFYGSSTTLFTQGDSLIGWQATDSKALNFTFSLISREEGKAIRIMIKITNIDSISHNFLPGLIFDPALGRWGDATAFINGEEVQGPGVLSSDITSVELWERANTPKGLGVQLEFPTTKPDTLKFLNWPDLHLKPAYLLDSFYDLSIKIQWPSISLLSNQEVTLILDVRLLPPDFPSSVFMRTDLPAFLSVENNLLFPMSSTPLVKIMNSSNQTMQNINLIFKGNELFDDWSSDELFNISPRTEIFKSFKLLSHDNYEARIIPVEIELQQSGEPIDKITRNVFVPAVPFSDSGLVVTIDSVTTADFPKVGLSFQAKVKETGILITQLRKENIFLYENQERIKDFTFGKDTTMNKADIVFVLDVTGSMEQEIAGVKNNIIEFSNKLAQQGIDYRLGMVTFLDYIENVYPLTDDVQTFQEYVNKQYAHGGDDTPENSLQALLTASHLDFRPTAKRIFIWITDANYHISDEITSLTVGQVIDTLLAKSIQVHCIGNNQYKVEYYDPIIDATGGKYFDILGNFRDILLELSRLPGTAQYQLFYTSKASYNTSNEVTLEIHYAGLGGKSTISFSPSATISPNSQHTILSAYPNPFNPVTHIKLKNLLKKRGILTIYNVLGQRVAQYNIPMGNDNFVVSWKAKNDFGLPVSNGIYFVRVKLFDQKGKIQRLPVTKLIYIK